MVQTMIHSRSLPASSTLLRKFHSKLNGGGGLVKALNILSVTNRRMREDNALAFPITPQMPLVSLPKAKWVELTTKQLNKMHINSISRLPHVHSHSPMFQSFEYGKQP